MKVHFFILNSVLVTNYRENVIETRYVIQQITTRLEQAHHKNYFNICQTKLIQVNSAAITKFLLEHFPYQRCI